MANVIDKVAGLVVGPQGPQGPQGPKGDTGQTGPQGATGATGATPNLTMGTVTTLEPDSPATATITGTAENPVLSLGIPKGRTGEVSQAEFDEVADDVSALKEDLSAVNDILFTNLPYTLDVSNFEYGGISVSSANGYTYSSSGRQVRTKQDYYVNLNAGDVLSIGDGSVNLTLVSDGSTITKTMELWVAWYDPATSTYKQRSAQTADFTAPITGNYVLNLRLTDYDTHFLTTYTDAIEKLSGKVQVIQSNESNLRIDLEKSERKSTKNPNCKFIAHQGYTSEAGVNQNRLQGYIDAVERGFDWAETDLRLTSDGYIVCCHDATFVDATSGATVTIATSTLAELQAHDYYGTTIATFEEIIKACKMHGIGLVLDQLSSAELVNKAYLIVKKYNMIDHVAWSVMASAGGVAVNTIVLHNYSRSNVFVTSAVATFQELIDYAEQMVTENNRVWVSIPYTIVTANDLITASESRSNNVGFAIWTPDTTELIRPLMPYVEFVFSNKIAFYDMLNAIE